MTILTRLVGNAMGSIEVYSPHCIIIGAEIRSLSDEGSSTASQVHVEVKSLGKGRYNLEPIIQPLTGRRGDSVVVSMYLDLAHQQGESSGAAWDILLAEKQRNIVQVVIPIRISRRCRQRGWRRLRTVCAITSSLHTQGTIPINAFQVYVSHPFIGARIGDRRGAHGQNGSTDRWSVIVTSRPGTADWMGGLEDDTPLGELCMPGTHESCALYGFPVSQCQQPATSIEIQLLDGIRYLDVRLRVVGDELLMYHGPRPQRSSLPVLLDVLHRFLVSHPTETFILCLKEETPPTHPDFAEMVCKAFAPHSKFWFLENRIPSLGEVRGKGILMTRFEATEGTWEQGLGIHPSTWPDSRPEGFSWDCSGTTVRTQDWYRVKTFLEIPEKFQVIVNHLQPTLEPMEGSPFSLSYTSASYFPLSLPTTIAKGFGWPDWGLGIYGVNQRMMYWLLLQISQGKKVKACLPMDYYRQCGDDRGLAEILVSMNFL